MYILCIYISMLYRIHHAPPKKVPHTKSADRSPPTASSRCWQLASPCPMHSDHPGGSRKNPGKRWWKFMKSPSVTQKLRKSKSLKKIEDIVLTSTKKPTQSAGSSFFPLI